MKFAADGEPGGHDRTRDAVVRRIVERGPQSAADLADQLGVSPAAVRRHLDALVAEGLLDEREPRATARRGRGRPARVYAVSDAGRGQLPHAYDDLASTALRYLREAGGEPAVAAFARHRADQLAERLTEHMDVHRDAYPSRAEALAGALTAHGYASTARAVEGTASPTSDVVTTGVQVCQHHCPVAHVAAEFPQLCEAETRAFENVLGRYVQRLATIAHGDGVCTTHVPTPPQKTDPALHPGGTTA